jgi:predicted PurR-regulated permease PerM
MIISVAVYPLHLSLSAKLGGRDKTSAIIFALLGLAILLVPTLLMAESGIFALKRIGTELASGSIRISPPDPSVAEWPIIGGKVFDIWSSGAANLQATINQFEPQLKTIGAAILRMTGSMALGVLQFVLSIGIASAFLVFGKSGYESTKMFSSSLLGARGLQLTDLAIDTIRSVAKGVIGIAIIQSLLSAILLVAMDVPAAGVWAALVLVLAIIQLPPLIVLGPIAVWVFTVSATLPAILFAVCAFIVSISDAFLKPMFLGRGMEIPMLVILLGAIGGAILSGIIGLFVGAVVLAIGYQVLTAWMGTDELGNPRQSVVAEEPA